MCRGRCIGGVRLGMPYALRQDGALTEAVFGGEKVGVGLVV